MEDMALSSHCKEDMKEKEIQMEDLEGKRTSLHFYKQMRISFSLIKIL